MMKMKPISFSEEENKVLESMLNVQERMQGTPKSTDPVKYPVWSIPVGKACLVYVPNHTVLKADGTIALRMDAPLVHSVKKGAQYESYRCINGLVKEGVLSGTCPLCVAVTETWDLANKIIKQKCALQGLNPDDKDQKDVKNIRSTEYGDRDIKDANKMYTFPIVQIETDDDECKKISKDENGNVKYKIFWYTISEQLYQEKWELALENQEDATHPGGMFFKLDYRYTPGNGKQQEARDAARKLKVVIRTIKGSDSLKKFFDEATKDWTPALAREVLYANMICAEKDLEALCDDYMIRTRQLLAVYDSANSGTAVANTSGAGYKLEKPANNQAADSQDANVNAVETDIDDGEEDGDIPLE